MNDIKVPTKPESENLAQAQETNRKSAEYPAPDKLETKEEKKIKPKRSWFKFFCSSCLVLAFVILLGLISAVAASGLIYVPGFSKVLYSEPSPTRLIDGASIKNIDMYFQQKFESDYSKSGKDKTLEVKITEQELTTLIEQGKFQNTSISELQAVVLKDRIEIYGRLKKGPINTVFVLDLLPKVKDKKLYLEPIDLSLGALNIPIGWVLSVSNLGDFLNQPLEIAEGMQILDIKLENTRINTKIFFKDIEVQSEPTDLKTSIYQST
jgi:uncharacterized protein YpmS